MNEFIISKDLVNAVIAHLAKQPYAEVYQLIATIHSECKAHECNCDCACDCCCKKKEEK